MSPFLLISLFFLSNLRPSLSITYEYENPCEPSDVTLFTFACNCNHYEPDLSLAQFIKCFITTRFPTNSSGRHEWASMAQLTGTINLEFVMRHRELRDFPPPFLFKSLQNLSLFQITSSGITSIPPHAFQESSSLHEVNLKDNLIENLEENAFENLGGLVQINLESNEIKVIGRRVFRNLPNLTHLALSSNSIETIHDQAFRELGNLEELELQKNNISILTPEVFMGLKNLKRLDLRKNKIQLLGNNVFNQLPDLEELDLTENKIISVSPTGFNGLKNLGRLALKGNKIVQFESGTFSQLSSIYFLDVRNNELETFSKDLVMDIYPNLVSENMQLMMEGNRFICDCRILWMGKLWSETASKTVQYYLNKTFCDPPHEAELSTSLLQKEREGNVTLLLSPHPESSTSLPGSRLLLLTYTARGEECIKRKKVRGRARPTSTSTSSTTETVDNSNEDIDLRSSSEDKVDRSVDEEISRKETQLLSTGSSRGHAMTLGYKVGVVGYVGIGLMSLRLLGGYTLFGLG